jgi:signal transduction histidine kinase
MKWLLQAGRWWLAAWCLICLAGGVLIARGELARLREAFETDARIVHRLLSQRAVEHDAMLATLALLQPPADGSQLERRLPSVYPQILEVLRRDGEGPWSDPALEAANTRSRESKRPTLANADFARGKFQVVLAAKPSSFALTIDLQRAVPWADWPTDPKTSPVHMTLESPGQVFVLQTGDVAPGGWRFDFRKHLAAESQPFDAVAVRVVHWGELPWFAISGWMLGSALLVSGMVAWLRQREQRQRAEELLRLGQVARLNTLGELAAGLAHELNQPLTAVLASTQAAQRLLAEEPPELDTARMAMAQATGQAHRAAEVVGRLRRSLEHPDPATQLQPTALQETVKNALHLLAPECARRTVDTQVKEPAEPVRVMADPVALEQIVHNLLMNALQALDRVGATERHLQVTLTVAKDQGILTVLDTGPGIEADALPHIFEPFFTTRQGGLGLGLSLCETLASNMGGSLTATNQPPHGAAFTLTLPLAQNP